MPENIVHALNVSKRLPVQLPLSEHISGVLRREEDYIPRRREVAECLKIQPSVRRSRGAEVYNRILSVEERPEILGPEALI